MSVPVRIPNENEVDVVFGDRIWVAYTGEQTGGALGALVAELPPQSGPGLHVHDESDEFFYIIEGDFRFKMGDRVIEASTGACLFVPRGVPHGFMNIGSYAGKVMATFTPAGPEITFIEVPTWPDGPPDEQRLADLNKRTRSRLLGHPLARVSFGWGEE